MLFHNPNVTGVVDEACLAVQLSVVGIFSH